MVSQRRTSRPGEAGSEPRHRGGPGNRSDGPDGGAPEPPRARRAGRRGRRSPGTYGGAAHHRSHRWHAQLRARHSGVRDPAGDRGRRRGGGGRRERAGLGSPLARGARQRRISGRTTDDGVAHCVARARHAVPWQPWLWRGGAAARDRRAHRPGRAYSRLRRLLSAHAGGGRGGGDGVRSGDAPVGHRGPPGDCGGGGGPGHQSPRRALDLRDQPRDLQRGDASGHIGYAHRFHKGCSMTGWNRQGVLALALAGAAVAGLAIATPAPPPDIIVYKTSTCGCCLWGSMIADPSDLEPLDDDDFPLGDGTTETEVVVVCPHCGEANELGLDPGGGPLQEYVEDCQVCCRPWRVTVRYGSDGSADVFTEPLDG